jgi:hypothetical protein
MALRRRGFRYRFSTPLEGTIQTLHDVVIEHAGERELVAIGDTAVRKGTDLVLEESGNPDRPRCRVTVVDSVPLIVDGDVRYRLRLAILS